MNILLRVFQFLISLSLQVPLRAQSGNYFDDMDYTRNLTDEQRLFRKLLLGYDKNTRPVFNASDPVTIFLGITLTQIFDLDEKNQVLTTNVWLDQEWHDQKLIWKPEDFNGLNKIRIPCRHIWKPDIVLYNSVEDYTDGYMQSLAMVSHDGTVFWPPIVKFQSTCQIDITYFPFDDQICNMKLGSWAYDGFQVDVNNRSVPVDLSNYVSNGEWHLVSVTAKRNVVYYPCCPEPFPDVIFTIHLQRRTLYYTYNVIIPCVMLSSLTLLVFWMSPDSGEKVTLGLTVLLAFSVFMLLIAENMPATSNFVPLIGMYLTSVMGITSMSVMLAVLVSNISYKGQHQIPLPRLMRYFIVGLARIMCTKLYYISPPNKTGGRVLSPARNRRNFYRVGNGTHVSNDSGCALVEYELGDTLGVNLENLRLPSSVRHQQAPASVRSRSGERIKEDDIDLILSLLKKLLVRESEREEEDDLNKQWEEAARVIDRFLFYIFFLLTILATIVTLVIMPLTKPEKPTVLT
ncbi:acetylcholine receptor subunit alpha-type acr-16-like precursor [Aplysia californica]|uniref:Acetylcholine receptor subunit alpha-type acr-16-like precursor n=1 Tax=Aplysia californica TaxID=6500 RepID=M4VNF2_APLCA|nr:acetylcholine receptor subunit alpha-type acr-16-like precursor [Aplysia californica]AGI03860.1 nicotinic acetylcholine receptor subunit type D [Aplysia californica]